MGEVTASDEEDKDNSEHDLFTSTEETGYSINVTEDKSTWEKGELTQDKIMLWATFLLCFLGFIRSGLDIDRHQCSQCGFLKRVHL